METNKILHADILDIVFEGRNKDYGAYQLRKTYNRRLTYSLAVMFAISLLAVAGKVLGKSDNGKKAPLIVEGVVTLANAPEKPVPPPAMPPPPKQEKIEQIKDTPPLIVKDPVPNPPPKDIDIDDVKIGTENIAGVKSDVVAPPVDLGPGTGAVAPPKVKVDVDEEVVSVQVQAQFPGGPDAWHKYLTRNLRVDVPAENGAAPGQYSVVVSFLVDREGNISEVKADNDPGFGAADEAVRVIKRGPKWIPAIQNGRNVIYRQRQQITFVVNEQ